MISAFFLMLAGIFFGDYKKIRTKYNKEKGRTDKVSVENVSSSCPGCTGAGCHK